MRAYPYSGAGNNSYNFYKQRTPPKGNILQRLWFFVTQASGWLWQFVRKSGWIVSSAFIILVVPTIMMHMLESEGVMSGNISA